MRSNHHFCLDDETTERKKEPMKEFVFLYTIKFATFLAIFFAPISDVLMFMCLLIFCDTITGIYAAKKRGDKITSYGMTRTTAKIVLTFIAIILSRGVEVIWLPNIPVAAIVSGYLCLTEFKSNLENISEATGNDLWKVILDRVTSFGKRIK